MASSGLLNGLKRTCSHARARAGADDIERMDDDEDMTKTVRGRKKTFTAGRPKLEPEPKVLSKATRIAPPKTLLPLPHARVRRVNLTVILVRFGAWFGLARRLMSGAGQLDVRPENGGGHQER